MLYGVAYPEAGISLVSGYEYHFGLAFALDQSMSLKITVDTYGQPRQGTSIALADRLDHPEANALRYAPSAPPARVTVAEMAGLSTS